ncbi:uncharacterized protein FOMMEDRAFT_149425 [Fomitiporia mediterranea MF3/22]|uniref:uncharacterized protein n=1 Tax=Fomitiporia mediterranea (strain MF3/22) TaxID=694068 RepID=UPI0004408886|nr:uncharacterized protein FOMMEDRAFT_149425 [Fomitiporia mediterranea MF3/22]EJC97968.1 hypothetical protein FOMMEDRAFT_149425 [Fomitiporia mediterranea MF3/22]
MDSKKRKTVPDSIRPIVKTKRKWNSSTIILTAAAVVIAAVAYKFFLSNSRQSKILADSLEIKTPAFNVVDLPGRGKGLIASRDIEQGELLIKEKPLILVPSSTTQSPVKVLKERLNALTQDERNAFHSLSYVTPGRDSNTQDSLSDDEMVLAIFQTNAISAGDSAGLFPHTARLNHGCSKAFNSVYSWRPHEGHLVVHALKPIKRGQELLTTYTDTKRPRRERQHYLKSYYDFTCSCSVCSLPESESLASDERLSKMSSLHQTFASWGTREVDGINASLIAKAIWEIGEEEGYWSERGRLAADVVHIAAAHSDENAVLAWAKLAHTWFSIELGVDSTQALQMQALLSNPRTHRAWASREPQSIELPDVIS